MVQPNPADDIARMCNTAEAYLADAELLATANGKQSHADYLLRLTAFEILLKALSRTHGLPPKKNHSYCRLYDALPESVRLDITRLARGRVGPTVDYSDVPKLLDTYHRNFAALRYAYERYEGKTAYQVHERARLWVERGARVEEADFAFFPEELFGLTEAIRFLLGRTAW